MVLATLYAAATILYSGIWMYYIRVQPRASLGTTPIRSLDNPGPGWTITNLEEGSSAERVGLLPGDRVVAINGRGLDDLDPYYAAVTRGRPGDVVHLEAERPNVAAPLQLAAALRSRSTPSPPPSRTEATLLEIVRCYPVLFLVVGLAVLFLRLDDRNAWLLAVLFGGFIAEAPLIQLEGIIPPHLRRFALFYKVIFSGMMPAIFYYFFAVFPVASPIECRWPGWKKVMLAAAAAVTVPVGLLVLAAGSLHPLWALDRRLGEGPSVALVTAYSLGGFALGLTSLVWNSVRAPTAEARRKIRVIAWGTLVALMPFLLLGSGLALATAFQRGSLAAMTPALLVSRSSSSGKIMSPYDLPYWMWVPTVLATFALPLSFAYSVVKHRVLEIPVLLRRSARYLLVQRGFVVLTFMLSVGATLIFVAFFSRLFQPRLEVAVPAGIAVGVGFGILLAWGGTQIERRVTHRIDRAFFRSAYDARQILQDLVEKTRTAKTRKELAALLEREVSDALHPATLVIYLETVQGRLTVERGWVPPGLESVPSASPLLGEIARRGQPWEVPPPMARRSTDLGALSPLGPECLVPILGRESRLVGLLVLGPRLSEEPYGSEDRRLLASVASQAGAVFDSIRLAEEITKHMEAERRAAYEIEIAKQVQAKLLPQKLPPLETLDYAGACYQAREVGGDYYDFLRLGPDRIALVAADICGKGISAALLMAHLQANLRSQYTLALDSLPRLLQSVNRLFYESTPDHQFATFFFGDYEGAARRLRFGNCGHPPPVLLRTDGSIERLHATATVLGLFEDWECEIGEVEFAAGDTLVIFTDGITEAFNDQREEFGEERLLETILLYRQEEIPSLVQNLFAAVKQFSVGEQRDDITLVVARAR